MLCVEDCLDALSWVRDIGGLPATVARAAANADALYDWVARAPWVEPLAVDPLTRSHTSVALRFVEPGLLKSGDAEALKVSRRMVRLLESEGAAYDIGAYRGMPPGLRIWCGTTVEKADILALLPWLEWAYAEARTRTDVEA
jgi:phosphoserine aminotransferase